MEKTLTTVLNEYLKQKDLPQIRGLKENKIWIIINKKRGKMLLKRLHDNHAFSISLQDKLYRQGVHVPKIIPTLDNKLSVKYGDSLYFLSKYHVRLNRLSVRQRIRALAFLHNQAQYLNLYPYAQESRYKEQEEFLNIYKRRIQQLKKWAAKCSDPTVQRSMGQMIRQAEQSYSRLNSLDVQTYLKSCATRQTICHGDFHGRNCFLTSQRKLLILDFDRAYHGPLLEDFRFLRLCLTRNRQYPQYKVRILFNQYFSYNPPEEKFKQIYFADTLFPHLFYQQVRKLAHKQKKKTLDQYAVKLAFVAEQEAKVKAFVDSQWLKKP